MSIRNSLSFALLCLVATLWAQATPSYVNLGYAPLEGSPPQGSGTLANITYFDGNATGAGHSFIAEANKKYKVIVDFTSASQSAVNMEIELYILKQGVLQGDRDDVESESYEYDHASQLRATLYYKANTSGSKRILLVDYNDNKLNYTVKVEEDNSTWYSDLDYTSLIDNNVTGSASTESDVYIVEGFPATGKGYSFDVTKDKSYKITATYTSTQSFEEPVGFIILKAGTLQGNLRNDIFDDGDGFEEGGKQITVTGSFIAETTERLKILLLDLNANSYNYEVSIEEVPTPLKYTSPQFVYEPVLFNVPKTGTLEPMIELDYWGDYDNAHLTEGKGFSFTAVKDREYIVTARLRDVKNTGREIDGGVYFLIDGVLSSDDEDNVIYRRNDYNYGEVVLSVTYTAAFSGNQRVLLQRDYGPNELEYTFEVKEVSAPLTLTQLLNQTTKTITYSDNLAFTQTGIVVDRVVGGELGSFGGYGNYYAVAYKITLAAGNNIRINSSKEGDSYLYVYKKDGAGYTLIDEDDDSGSGDSDSYLNFTASSAGDYYIVVTDFNADVDGAYTISVKSVPAPITLTQLLNQTTKAITYSDNLSFAQSGETVARVAGDDVFGYSGDNYYAVAYKITLAEGNNIKIRSSKEGDSYMYVYKRDGVGYTLEDYDDDGGANSDSYLEFTASSAGDYYIVVSDYEADVDGVYTLKVWNTAGEPTPIKGRTPAIAGNIRAQTTSNAIVLSNLPANTKVDVYNLQGKLMYSGNSANSPNMSIPNQTKGVYIVRAGVQTFNLTVK